MISLRRRILLLSLAAALAVALLLLVALGLGRYLSPADLLHEAVWQGDLARVRELIEMGTDVNAKSSSGKTQDKRPIWERALLSTDKARFRYSQQDPRIIDFWPPGSTPLHVACIYGKKDAAEILIRSGADLNALDSGEGNPLYYAICMDHRDLAELLIRSGADVKLRHGGGQTALHSLTWVRQAYREDIARDLIQAGADVNAADRSGRTPLHESTYGNVADGAKYADVLIKAGAVLDVRDHRGCTPLAEAADSYNTDLVKCLIDAGADVNVADQDGMTPLHHAAEHESLPILRLLLEAKADMNAKNKKGQTALGILIGKQKWTIALRASPGLSPPPRPPGDESEKDVDEAIRVLRAAGAKEE